MMEMQFASSDATLEDDDLKLLLAEAEYEWGGDLSEGFIDLKAPLDLISRFRAVSPARSCSYDRVFPVDPYGRLGGPFSLADCPVAGHKKMTRLGLLLVARFEVAEGNFGVQSPTHFFVQDRDAGFCRWSAACDVSIEGTSLDKGVGDEQLV